MELEQFWADDDDNDDDNDENNDDNDDNNDGMGSFGHTHTRTHRQAYSRIQWTCKSKEEEEVRPLTFISFAFKASFALALQNRRVIKFFPSFSNLPVHW